jgi:hypothetical protein
MSDVEYERTVMQLRAEYMDAAINECAVICNLVMSEDQTKHAQLSEAAKEAGVKAQDAFEKFFAHVNDYRASKENAN